MDVLHHTACGALDLGIVPCVTFLLSRFVLSSSPCKAVQCVSQNEVDERAGSDRGGVGDTESFHYYQTKNPSFHKNKFITKTVMLLHNPLQL